MRISPAQKTTKLGTELTFHVIDLRGTHGFPQSRDGLAFEHWEQRLIACKFKRDARYVVRTAPGEPGWRIDLLPKMGPVEAVYGVEATRPSYWPTAQDAARALVGVLDEIQHNSSLGGSESGPRA